MRKRSIRAVAAFLLLTILSVLILTLIYTDDFGRIDYGMSRLDVHSILGPEFNGPSATPCVVWGTEHRMVDLWEKNDKSIIVGYDSQWKVNFIESFDHGPIPTAIKRLKRMFGI